MLIVISLVMASCKTDFGDRYTVGNLEVYFTPEISKEYVEGVAQYFKANDLILDTKQAIQLTSDNKSFILRMVLNPELTVFPGEQKPVLRAMEQDIKADVFAGLNFRIEVCDGNFNPIAAANP